ncbi:hypothetical protein D7Y15_30165 [Corallococcus sp. AB030]|uniref:hypothetical protein n=1 Tax=Corallococcus sp. AB030 TaxID=2316716 RepID=UPI000EBBD337|nr:hypothetical protein [Corallococcus sp. AB030]RKI06638.1 hypothetical protein D7Y15_30165 [Corallococcus sp. AB030]
MREGPISFTVPLVREVMAGRKTVTRRLIKPQPTIDLMGNLCWKAGCYGQTPEGRPQVRSLALLSPYGKAGDRLWVRERARVALHGRPGHVRLFYEVDGATAMVLWPDRLKPAHVGRCVPNGVHREGARIFLDVVSVHAERLHDITEEDAWAEGVERHPEACGWLNYEPSPSFEEVSYHVTARESFTSLWRSINGAESWDANPWVWRVEFRRVEGSR